MRQAGFGLLAVALLATLWLGLRPAPPTDDAVAAPVPRRFSLTVPPAPGAESLLRVPQGASVELTVTSAEDDELHLHGYDLALPLRAGEPATLVFIAQHAGRFEIELHHRHAGIGALEVSPR